MPSLGIAALGALTPGPYWPRESELCSPRLRASRAVERVGGLWAFGRVLAQQGPPALLGRAQWCPTAASGWGRCHEPQARSTTEYEEVRNGRPIFHDRRRALGG
jgi:hypothetical protein